MGLILYWDYWGYGGVILGLYRDYIGFRLRYIGDMLRLYWGDVGILYQNSCMNVGASYLENYGAMVY